MAINSSGSCKGEGVWYIIKHAQRYDVCGAISAITSPHVTLTTGLVYLYSISV